MAWPVPDIIARMSTRPKAPRVIHNLEGWEDDGRSRFLGLRKYNSIFTFDGYQPQWQLFDNLQGLLDEFVNELEAVFGTLAVRPGRVRKSIETP